MPSDAVKNSKHKSSRETSLLRGLALLSGLLITTSFFMGLLGNETANAQTGNDLISVPLNLPQLAHSDSKHTDQSTRATTQHQKSSPLLNLVPIALPPSSNETVDTVTNADKSTDKTVAMVAITPLSKTVTKTPVNIKTESTANTSTIWNEEIVRKGDTLSAIFDRNNIHSELEKVLQQKEAKKHLVRIKPGEIIKLDIDAAGLNALEYTIDNTHLLNMYRSDDNNSFTTKISEHQYDITEQHAQGIITDSLFASASEAGLSDNLIMQLANIFGYDIDFALDIREGDSYGVIYEDRYLDGEKAKGGNILAAEFSSRGETYRAVRYINPNKEAGYFNPSGRSMKKAFLRTPVNFTRISSKFNLKRKHPVLHKIRAHKGVDYAAPRGTPVKSSSNGKIIWRSRKGGYGKAVIIQHGSSYSTLYAHLNNYRKGQKVGSRVKQGEIIGYVGSTGRTTGPHLHYEFRVNGVHRNPLTIKLPKADPLPAKYMQDFKQKSEPYLAWLNSLNSVALSD